MKPAGFFAASRLVIVARKGGVGKTTVTATLARAAALQGFNALAIEIEGKTGLSSLFGSDQLSYEETLLNGGGAPSPLFPGVTQGAVRGRALTADTALGEYLDSHGLRRVSKRLMSSGLIDVAATAAPGMKDILLLGKVKQLEVAAPTDDVIIVDAPAAGHAITFLLAAKALLESVRVGPIRTQAEAVLAMLSDPKRCQVILVALPEETPVNELIDTAYHLEDRVGVALGPVVLNAVYPTYESLDLDPGCPGEDATEQQWHQYILDSATKCHRPVNRRELDQMARTAKFRSERLALQRRQGQRLAETLPLPQITLPYLFDAEIGPPQLELLATAMATQLGVVQ